jgi:hypothetical protein
MRIKLACTTADITRAAWVVLVGALGCGLISSDITKVSFNLPSKSYSFDTNNGMFKAPPGGTFPAVPCGAGEVVMDCCHPPAPLPAIDCTATPLFCEAAVCTLKYPVTVVQTMDLSKEAPELSSFKSQSLVDISISRIHYAVTANTLNVDLPPIDLFLAPQGVMTADDPSSAEKFGTIAAVTAMTTPDADVKLASNSKAVFNKYAHAFGTPFNFIATTTVVVPSGTPIPNGRVDITVTGQLSAQASF